jgi:hypothetical protein
MTPLEITLALVIPVYIIITNIIAFLFVTRCVSAHERTAAAHERMAGALEIVARNQQDGSKS